jgi:hypothetical protein
MVTLNDIIDAANVLVVAVLPELQQVHINACPKDFERPAALIECQDDDMMDVSCKTVSRNVYLTLTYFGTVDERNQTDINDLNTAKDKMLSAFTSGYLVVGDRKLRIEKIKGGTGFSDAVVDIHLKFYDDRVMTAVAPPVAAAVNTIIKQEG